MPERSEIPFDDVIAALLDADHPLPPLFFYRLSDLEGDDLARLQAAWPEIPLWRRQALMEEIDDLWENDTLLWFAELGKLAARDEDPKVRSLGVRSLWEYDDIPILPVLLEMLSGDPDVEVRAAVAHLLGKYVYLGEMEEMDEGLLHQVEQRLLDVLESAEADVVRRAALEALGYSSRSEAAGWIERSFASPDRQWVVSALFAMGRTADPAWKPQVLQMLQSPLAALRSEAARAAGEIELKESTPFLMEMLKDTDEDIRMASIWSLSLIGGEGVRRALEGLLKTTPDEAEVEFIESALENLAFAEGLQALPMLNPAEEEWDGLDSAGVDELDEDFLSLGELDDDEED